MNVSISLQHFEARRYIERTGNEIVDQLCSNLQLCDEEIGV